ncbi:hypothetical protein KAU11_09070, partial [Candidatus Babeliales bacterium]|nr:hypothetical protein [Candidatus Babeliales bacterium]
MEHDKNVTRLIEYEQSPIVFIGDMWGLYPLKEGEEFIKGKHISPDQLKLLTAVELALARVEPPRISAASGHGCHAKGTEVLMYNGDNKKVEDVEAGDLLMGDDSTPRKVSGLCRGREKMYEVKYVFGESYIVNESHILSVVATQSHGRQRLGDVTNVSVRDYLCWSDRRKRTNVGYKAGVSYKKRRVLIDPYVFGVWLADGGSNDGRVYNPDKEIVDVLVDYGVTSSAWKGGCYNVGVKGLSKKLKRLGVRGDKHIPKEYLVNDRGIRLELLAGLIDGDGYLGSGCYEITQKREGLSNDIVQLARSLGFHCTIKKVRKECVNNGVWGDYFRMTISRGVHLIPVKVERRKYKEKKGKNVRKNLRFKIKVSPLPIDDYYGFELDRNHLYLLKDFTVTHNTGKSTTLSWLIIWYLFTFFDSQIACTAPTSSQLKDVLWKEISIWINKLPEGIKECYDHTSSHVRMKVKPDSWFARARTASKESPEALAGVHGEFVMM